MDLVTCPRCRLIWVQQSNPHKTSDRCPYCLRWVAAPQEPVPVAGRLLGTEQVRIVGNFTMLNDAMVRCGVAKLRLGEMCEHGYLSELICKECIHAGSSAEKEET